MRIKPQLYKLKENWLLILLLVVLVLALNNFPSISTLQQKSIAYDTAGGIAERSFYPNYDNGFAPEERERVITKASTLNSDIKAGEFQTISESIKSIASSSESIILSENINKNEVNKRTFITASYNIKVPTSNYDNVISQFKNLGEVKYFSENSDDITKQKVDLETNLAAERERLTRYKTILAESKTAQEKIDITDRIFNQERTIKYYEESLANVHNRVSYSTVYLTVSEKSDYSDIALIKLPNIAKNFVNSLNTLIKWVIFLIPWIIGLAIIVFIYKKVKRN